MTSSCNRPIAHVPRAAIALAITALTLQLAFTFQSPRPQARATDLGEPPTGAVRRLTAGFDPVPAAHLVALYLQSFDNQPGISIPFRELDYHKVSDWLETTLQLDPGGQYPLLMASQLYAQVNDAQRQRLMLEFVYEHFGADPERRWPWLAHCSIMAKHRLQDLPLALKFAQAIAEKSRSAPAWARQMHIFLREDLGEFETARLLLGGLLASGTVTDSHERVLLLERLERLKSAEISSGATRR